MLLSVSYDPLEGVKEIHSVCEVDGAQSILSRTDFSVVELFGVVKMESEVLGAIDFDDARALWYWGWVCLNILRASHQGDSVFDPRTCLEWARDLQSPVGILIRDTELLEYGAILRPIFDPAIAERPIEIRRSAAWQGINLPCVVGLQGTWSAH